MAHSLAALILVLAVANADDFITSSPTNDNAVVVTNVRVGVVCGKGESRRVCFETKDIQITNESTCVYNGSTVPCTWYGYSFDYKSSLPDMVLQCEYFTSEPFDEGNPREIIARNTTHGNFEMKLPGVSGHFFNPQYTAVADSTILGRIDEDKQICSYKGTKLFEVNYRLHFPEK